MSLMFTPLDSSFEYNCKLKNSIQRSELLYCYIVQNITFAKEYSNLTIKQFAD